MAVELLSRQLSRVAIVDDQPESRKSYSYTVEDAELEPVAEDGPLGSLDDYLRSRHISQYADAALCDYRLGGRAYASFSGAQLVARWYKENFPALLCTRWEKAQIEHIRPYRRWIPVLMTPDELTVDTLMDGLKECLFELNGNFRPHRRPWRTQVHFLSKDDDQRNTYFAEIPGWERNDVIRVSLTDLPQEVATMVRDDWRCHARANLGAESPEELYLCDWETR
ncbi:MULTISPECIES: hypothetical protein [Micromonospora]|uniref:hypothetical protein n=1 Tax=Micromonospora TaxID=1873 RepID=UPI000F5E8A7C|nr:MULTISPECIES: hypothetical protein [Micromonospora]